MTAEDDEELGRLCGLVAEADKLLPAGSAVREGLKKSALALQLAFASGLRTKIEQTYDEMDLPLSDSQIAHLKSLGLHKN
jgi:hypothetical protein